jgi:hypothetical protein
MALSHFDLEPTSTQLNRKEINDFLILFSNNKHFAITFLLDTLASS